MDEEHFCLKWNNYHSNIQSVFTSLLAKENLVDVTLACEGKQLRCHKIVLSAGSSYFEDLFTREDVRPSIVFLKGVHFADLQAVLQFMYCGEVDVLQQDFPSLLQLALELKVKGLADEESFREEVNIPKFKKRRRQSREVPQKEMEEDTSSKNAKFWPRSESAKTVFSESLGLERSPTKVQRSSITDNVSISLLNHTDDGMDSFTQNHVQIKDETVDITQDTEQTDMAFGDSVVSEESRTMEMSYLNSEVQHDAMKMPTYCQICWKSFKSTQGLSVHMICIHGQKLDKTSPYKIEHTEESRASEDLPYESHSEQHLPFMLEAPSEHHRGKDNTPPYMLESPSEPRRSKDNTPLTRRSYDAVFKAEVIARVAGGESIANVAEAYQINKSLISRWLKNKYAINEAASHPNLNLAKLHPMKGARDFHPVLLQLADSLPLPTAEATSHKDLSTDTI